MKLYCSSSAFGEVHPCLACEGYLLVALSMVAVNRACLQLSGIDCSSTACINIRVDNCSRLPKGGGSPQQGSFLPSPS